VKNLSLVSQQLICSVTIVVVTKPRLFLKYLFENRVAVPSSNRSNLEMARAVVEAAILEDAAVMTETGFVNSNYCDMP
jgi:fructose/tagatose bisphosphate aldolase